MSRRRAPEGGVVGGRWKPPSERVRYYHVAVDEEARAMLTELAESLEGRGRKLRIKDVVKEGLRALAWSERIVLRSDPSPWPEEETPEEAPEETAGETRE